MSTVPQQPTAPAKWPWFLLAALLLLAAGALTLRSLERNLNHDEHQFVAPAVLMAREGLVPYQDFALFHMPGSVWLYAAALSTSNGSPLVAARLVSLVGTLLLAGTVVYVAKPLGPWWIMLFLGLILFDPLFLTTTGKTWNHELPTGLVLLAACLTLATWERQTWWMLLTSGFCMGFAGASRLTHLPISTAFVLSYLLLLPTWQARARAVGWWMAGWCLGMTPCAYYALKAPEAFRFDNFEFPRLRLLDPADTRVQKTTTLGRKIRFLIKEVLFHSWPVLVAYLGAWVVTWRRQPGWRSPGVLLSSLLLLWGIIGSFAPSRYQYQHFYLLIPFLIFAAILLVCGRMRWPNWYAGALSASLAVYVFLPQLLPSGENHIEGWRAYQESMEAWQPVAWQSRRLAQQHAALAAQVPRGEHVLTLAPITPLEMGYKIYPAFATGPFAWRLAHLVKPERRAQLHLVAYQDLNAYLESQPPAAILVGYEKPEQEAPLVAYAEGHQYRATKLGKGRTLWVRPGVTPPAG